MTNRHQSLHPLRFLTGPRLAFLTLVAACGYFLWTEHQAHILGALPYLILLLCPLMHLFMHRGHGGHGKQNSNKEEHDHHSQGGAQ